MNSYHLQILSKFHLVGISYHNMPTSLRGQFAVNNDQYNTLLQTIKKYEGLEFFVLSTCNRTEIYFLGNFKSEVTEAFCKVTEVDEVVLNAYAYHLSGSNAIKHMFKVATGLDSQILGDYEIVGQMKRAFQYAQERGTINVLMDRIFQHVLQAARNVRTNTQISTGSVSVAFSAAQFVANNIQNTNPKIIIVGAGEIGRNTTINLKNLLPNAAITIANRTLDKADKLAEEVNGESLMFSDALQIISTFDVIIFASNASHYLLNRKELNDTKESYVLVDLSIPQNINPDVQLLKQVVYANVDTISKINDDTLQTRALEIPKVESIINTHYDELMSWLSMRKMVPMIKEIKEKLSSLDDYVTSNEVINKKPVIQNVINSMTQKLKDKSSSNPGCTYIETYVAYFDKMSK